MTIRVAVTGAEGRMGSTATETIRAAGGMELVATLDVKDEVSPESLNAAEVTVDFSIPNVVESNVHALFDTGIDVVVGTTGWTEESYERVRMHAEELGKAILIAPSFAMGAVLTVKFAALIAPYFESAEVIEIHYPDEVDTSSGTATAAARGVGATRKDTGLNSIPSATQSDPEGIRGGLIDDVPIHAVHLRGLTASGEILLGDPSEQLVIHTDSFDRVSFIPGVILAIRSIRGCVGLTTGFDKIFGI